MNEGRQQNEDLANSLNVRAVFFLFEFHPVFQVLEAIPLSCLSKASKQGHPYKLNEKKSTFRLLPPIELTTFLFTPLFHFSFSSSISSKRIQFTAIVKTEFLLQYHCYSFSSIPIQDSFPPPLSLPDCDACLPALEIYTRYILYTVRYSMKIALGRR